MALAGFSFLLMTRTDVVMLGYFAPAADVGTYRAAVALANLVVFGLGVVNTAFAPLIAHLYRQGTLVELGRMYQTAARWATLLGLAAALPLLLFPAEILRIYGAGFQDGGWALVALVAFQLVNAGVGSVGFMLQMSGHQDWVLGNNVFTAALNIGLNLWWIPSWGILGAALATGTALAVNNLLGVIEVRKFLAMQPFSRDYARLAAPILAASGAFALLRFLDLAWWVDLMVVMAAFVFAFALLGMSKDDLVILRAVRSRLRR
jgi:O-antigen/teichoic acid export membrane protein